LVTENGSLTPICSLSPNLTVLLKIIFSVPKNKLSEINKTYIDIGNGQQGSNWLPKSGLAISNAAQRRAAAWRLFSFAKNWGFKETKFRLNFVKIQQKI
jgi:hypothetical protein